MAEFETPETGNTVSSERFQQKRKEAETGMRPFPDEIRGTPIDFAKAKEALAAKPKEQPEEGAAEIKITAGSESGFAELNDERFKLMAELGNSLRKTEDALHAQSETALEKIRQSNPDLAAFLEQQTSLGLIKDFHATMKNLVYRAGTKEELDKIAEKSREFLASITKIS